VEGLIDLRERGAIWELKMPSAVRELGLQQCRSDRERGGVRN
jgi:hypothetical protein